MVRPATASLHSIQLSPVAHQWSDTVTAAAPPEADDESASEYIGELFSCSPQIPSLPLLLQPTAPHIPLPGTVSSPFDSFSLPTGGVVLKCSDGGKLKVYKNILSLASPVFKDMFMLPQPKDEAEAMDSDDDEVEISEETFTMDMLLRLIYPISPPQFPGQFDNGEIFDPQTFIRYIQAVLAAALKYDMTIVVQQLFSKIMQAADNVLPNGKVADETLALRAFIVACRHGLKNEAIAAARATLRGHVTSLFIPELRDLNAAQFFRLIEYHSKIKEVAESAMKPDLLPYHIKFSTECPHCGTSVADSGSVKSSRWWLEFVKKARPIFQKSPLSEIPFSEDFMTDIFQKANTCTRYTDSCENSARGKWLALSKYLRETIDNAALETKMKFDEIV